MNKTICPVRQFNKTLEVPPDKSITHRAIMLGGIARGSSLVTNALLGEDCLNTIECMRALGAKIEVDGDSVVVVGAENLACASLYAGNSGTTMRLLAGLLCGRRGEFTISGDKSLSMRPMNRVILPLEQMGAQISSANGRAPLNIVGSQLVGKEITLSVASAQVKSACLLAALSASGITTVSAPRSRNHTELMLKSMGAKISVEKASENDIITIEGGSLRARNTRVVGDISSAAYPLAMACVTPASCVTVRGVGINSTRDGFLEVLAECGANITVANKNTLDEPYADITLSYAKLAPINIDGNARPQLIPRLIDELPILATIAAFIDGKSVIRGARELRVKESDRIAEIEKMLKAFGAKVNALDDGLEIFGTGELRGGNYDCNGDHRMAMCASVALSASRLGGQILDAECVNVSYPNFYDIFD